jgi:hypothetical protein
MGRARRFLRLSADERRLVLGAALLMTAIRLALSLVSLRALRRLLARWAPGAAPSRRLEGPAPDDLARAVARASAAVPGATCLVQALALEALLERRGCPARLRVGFAGGEGRTLTGHAWVESEGRVLAAGDDVSRYAPMPGLGRDRS